jgi:hypothetical protein
VTSRAAYQREWRKKNTARVKQYSVKRRQSQTPEEREAEHLKQAEWRRKNAAKIKEYSAKRYLERTEDERESARVRVRRHYKEKNARDPEGARAERRAYYERNKEKIKARVNAQRKERVAKDPEGVRAKRRAKYYADVKKSRAYTNEWRKKNPEHARKSSLRRKFGLFVEHYEALLRSQKGGCAICGSQNLNGKALAVDHCHKTGKIRGLLCAKCNTGIGLFGDSIQLLKAAAEYVAGDTSWRLKIADEYLAKWEGR